jgi:hypothetical protein
MMLERYTLEIYFGTRFFGALHTYKLIPADCHMSLWAVIEDEEASNMPLLWPIKKANVFYSGLK